ncbi:MAG TPA: HAD family hydrolase [Dehalococcoidia bacterium]|nr:HAD family hydrolase [Dehalococcoidia bacterium]
MRPRAVLFDLFGTLVHFSPEGYRRVLAEVAQVLTAPPFEFAQLWDAVRAQRETTMAGTLEEGLHYVLRTLGVYTHLDQFRRAVDLLHEADTRIEPYPDALSALRDLRRRGLKAAVVANAVATTARQWPASELAAQVDAAVFSCEAGARQPDARIYAAACDRLGVPACDCLYVGGSASPGIAGAEAAGMHPIVLVREDSEEARPSRGHDWPGPRVRSLAELAMLVGPGIGRRR